MFVATLAKRGNSNYAYLTPIALRSARVCMQKTAENRPLSGKTGRGIPTWFCVLGILFDVTKITL